MKIRQAVAAKRIKEEGRHRGSELEKENIE